MIKAVFFILTLTAASALADEPGYLMSILSQHPEVDEPAIVITISCPDCKNQKNPKSELKKVELSIFRVPKNLSRSTLVGRYEADAIEPGGAKPKFRYRGRNGDFIEIEVERFLPVAQTPLRYAAIVGIHLENTLEIARDDANYEFHARELNTEMPRHNLPVGPGLAKLIPGLLVDCKIHLLLN